MAFSRVEGRRRIDCGKQAGRTWSQIGRIMLSRSAMLMASVICSAVHSDVPLQPERTLSRQRRGLGARTEDANRDRPVEGEALVDAPVEGADRLLDRSRHVRPVGHDNVNILELEPLERRAETCAGVPSKAESARASCRRRELSWRTAHPRQCACGCSPTR
jgi:hypothetical protein